MINPSSNHSPLKPKLCSVPSDAYQLRIPLPQRFLPALKRSRLLSLTTGLTPCDPNTSVPLRLLLPSQLFAASNPLILNPFHIFFDLRVDEAECANPLLCLDVGVVRYEFPADEGGLAVDTEIVVGTCVA